MHLMTVGYIFIAFPPVDHLSSCLNCITICDVVPGNISVAAGIAAKLLENRFAHLPDAADSCKVSCSWMK